MYISGTCSMLIAWYKLSKWFHLYFTDKNVIILWEVILFTDIGVNWPTAHLFFVSLHHSESTHSTIIMCLWLVLLDLAMIMEVLRDRDSRLTFKADFIEAARCSFPKTIMSPYQTGTSDSTTRPFSDLESVRTPAYRLFILALFPLYYSR